MRNILEFGYGDHSTAFCKDGDNLLGSEPLLSLFAEIHKPEVVLNFFQVDEIALANYDGVCDLHVRDDSLEEGFTPLGTTDWEPPLRSRKRRVPCLTLDSWLARYSEQGFTDRIDCINCTLNGNTADIIFENFSFEPRPEVIMIRQHLLPRRTLERMEGLGYNCFTSGSWGIGIEAEGLLVAK